MKSAVTLKNVRHKTELNSRPEVSVHRSSFMDRSFTDRACEICSREEVSGGVASGVQSLLPKK